MRINHPNYAELRELIEPDLADISSSNASVDVQSAIETLKTDNFIDSFGLTIRNDAISEHRSNALTATPVLNDRAYIMAKPVYEAIPRFSSFDHNDLIIGVDDLFRRADNLVTFSFQKRKGEPTFLLPDLDLVGSNYLESDYGESSTPWDHKEDSAIFAGATTGISATGRSLLLDKNSLDSSERIRYAKAFLGSRQVKFFLPKIVQCADDETRLFLAEQDYCAGNFIPWTDQTKHKFIISMDGNGATLNRVAKSLISNSILLKSKSNYVTYYHRALRNFENFLEFDSPEDILSLREFMLADRRLSHAVLEGARHTASRYLNRASIIRYTATCLNEYSRIRSGETFQYLANRAKIDSAQPKLSVTSHVSQLGDVWNYPAPIAGQPGSGLPLESVTLFSHDLSMDNRGMLYQAITASGVALPWISGGSGCGSVGNGMPLRAFRVRIDSRASVARRLHCFGKAIHDSRILTEDIDGYIYHPNGSPLESVVFELQ